MVSMHTLNVFSFNRPVRGLKNLPPPSSEFAVLLRAHHGENWKVQSISNGQFAREGSLLLVTHTLQVRWLEAVGALTNQFILSVEEALTSISNTTADLKAKIFVVAYARVVLVTELTRILGDDQAGVVETIIFRIIAELSWKEHAAKVDVIICDASRHLLRLGAQHLSVNLLTETAAMSQIDIGALGPGAVGSCLGAMDCNMEVFKDLLAQSLENGLADPTTLCEKYNKPELLFLEKTGSIIGEYVFRYSVQFQEAHLAKKAENDGSN